MHPVCNLPAACLLLIMTRMVLNANAVYVNFC